MYIGSVWIAAGRNIQLTRHATIATGLYTLSAIGIMTFRSYVQLHQNRQLRTSDYK